MQSNDKERQKRQTQTDQRQKTGPEQYANEGINLQSSREPLRNNESRSQAIILEFMMKLEDVGGDGQERPFRRDFRGSPAQETAIIQILLGKGEGAFGLNGAVRKKQNQSRKKSMILKKTFCYHILLCGGCRRMM